MSLRQASVAPLLGRSFMALGLLLLAAGRIFGADEPDLLIADFEGADYGSWTASGEAFGPGPARGALPDQMPVTGYAGAGLVNSYYHGDATVGTLLSPEFRVERKYINFLIGGGDHPNETFVQLLVDGKPVRTASGANNEQLDWETWDVGDLAGKSARIEVVDRNTGGWGHLNLDQIYQSSERRAAVPEAVPLYQESLRPQFHFTARRNWLNDPNGLVFDQGEYHLFFQHNPQSTQWGNMTWGHAVSPDLVHWTQLADALKPDRLGTMFSGSAVVDWKNTSGFQTGKESPLVAIYTSAGGTSPESQGQPFTQSIAASNDRGRTWQVYDKNPVLGHILGGNRDPKVFWHEASRRWVMALYLDGEQYALFGSPDLKAWTKLSDLPTFGASECPDMFELALDGKAGETRWIFWGANNNYLIGRFDGTTFTNESGPHRFEFGGNYYAAQTYSDIPRSDGRRIQIAWMQGGNYPKMPFNQQMSFPSELLLKSTGEGPRLFRRPVSELGILHGKPQEWHGKLERDVNLQGDAYHLRASISPAAAQRIVWNIRGVELAYDTARNEWNLLGKTAPGALVDGQIRIDLLVDRSSIELFSGGGLVTMSSCFTPKPDDKRLVLQGPGATVESLELWPISSTWPVEK